MGILLAEVEGVRAQQADALPRSPLRLSEVLADPAEDGRDAPLEWVELENLSDASVLLDGWQVGDSKTLDRLAGGVSVPAHAFVVVAAKSVALPDGVLAVRPADGEIGSGLNNDTDTVRLIDPNGTLIDVVEYGEDAAFHDRGPRAATAGHTIAIDAASSRWRQSLTPSPGAVNTFPSAADRVRAPVEPASSDSSMPWIVLAITSAVGGFSGFVLWQRWRQGRKEAAHAR
jgi:hypothetical protein